MKKKIRIKWTPHRGGQRAAHKSKARFKVLACGRRWGKTLFAWIQLLIDAMRNPNELYWWVAPIYKELVPASQTIKKWTPPEAIIELREEEILIPSIIHKKYEQQNVIRYIRLPNNTEIYFHSADREDSLRGSGLKGLVVDEAPAMKEERWTAELRPSLIDKQGWAIFIGTPKGQNWHYRNYLKGQDLQANPEWESWAYSSHHNPHLERKELENAKKELPELIYRQEILAEFLPAGGQIFRLTDDHLTGATGSREEGKNYSLGADLAKTQDFTVLIAIDNEGHVRGFDRFQQLDWNFQKRKIKDFSNRYGGVMYLDSTGVGDPIYDDLRREGVRVRGYKFTSESKRQLVENLSLKIDARPIEVTIPEDLKVLINEVRSFSYEMLPSGNIRYGAPEGLHDDCGIALALAVWGISKSKPVVVW